MPDIAEMLWSHEVNIARTNDVAGGIMAAMAQYGLHIIGDTIKVADAAVLRTRFSPGSADR
jgi:hypothetical protein